MDLKLQNKRSLVTGSTAGIGYAIAEALSREGASVIINGRSQQSVDDAIDRIRPNASGVLTGFAGDLTREDVAEKLAREHPDIEILVNSLGIFEPVPFEQIPDEDWRRFFEVNVLSGVRLSRLYLSGMKQRNWGRIIFISSESGIQIPPEMIHYGMSKAAQIAIARGLAESVAGTGITVNSILPGPTRSRGVVDFVGRIAKEKGKTFDDFAAGFVEEMRPSSIIKRFATTEEVASLVAYIASPLSSATTGAALRVDGGVIRSAF
jgi:NAD(P)-dependent dehydrogenase (short-subunit alcohol dehydrogenase family)